LDIKNIETIKYPASKKLAAQRVEKARFSNLRWTEKRKKAGTHQPPISSWKRETRRLPRKEAREFARSFLKQFPKAAYWTEVENWRMLDGDIIEFTMRRLPSAD